MHAMMPASPATYSAYHSAAAAAAAASCAISIFIFAINDSKSSSSSSPSSSCPSSSSCCSCPPSCPPSSSASCNSPPRRPSLQTPPPPPPPPPAAAAAASASSSSQRCKIASRAVFLRSSAAYVARRCETENGRPFLEFSQKSSRACRGGFTYQVKARSKTPKTGSSPAAAARVGRPAAGLCATERSVLEFSLHLSRACPGKMIIFIYQWLNKVPFLT
jgi:hypothetical protein